MKHVSYRTSGTCSRLIEFDIDDENKIHGLQFVGGCNGNLQGIGRLAEGQDAKTVANILRGVNCNGKGTSCPDQLSRAIDEAMAQ